MKRTKQNRSSILALDPSFTAWGWAVLQGNMVVDTGCIKTAPEAKKRRIREGDDRARRTNELVQELIRVIKTHNVKFIVSELPHGSQNAKAAVMIGIVMGIVQTLANVLNIPLEWYSEGDAKKALLNRQAASKKDIQEAIGILYDVPWMNIKYYDEAVADALAVYYCAECNSQILKMLNR